MPAVMSSALDIPGVHVVPAAIATGVDKTPEAHCWNEEPPARQNHVPSMQAANCASVVPFDETAAVDVAGTVGDGVSRVPSATAQGGAGCRLVLIVPFTTEEPPSG